MAIVTARVAAAITPLRHYAGHWLKATLAGHWRYGWLLPLVTVLLLPATLALCVITYAIMVVIAIKVGHYGHCSCHWPYDITILLLRHIAIGWWHCHCHGHWAGWRWRWLLLPLLRLATYDTLAAITQHIILSQKAWLAAIITSYYCHYYYILWLLLLSIIGYYYWSLLLLLPLLRWPLLLYC